MPIARLDHVTICTRDVARAVAFYRDVVGLRPGARPDFSFDGAWLYCADQPVVHIVDRAARAGAGVIDHIAFAGTGLDEYLARLRTRAIPHDLKPLPSGVPHAGTLQLFFRDPDGARIEIDFPPSELPAERSGQF